MRVANLSLPQEKGRAPWLDMIRTWILKGLAIRMP